MRNPQSKRKTTTASKFRFAGALSIAIALFAAPVHALEISDYVVVLKDNSQTFHEAFGFTAKKESKIANKTIALVTLSSAQAKTIGASKRTQVIGKNLKAKTQGQTDYSVDWQSDLFTNNWGLDYLDHGQNAPNFTYSVQDFPDEYLPFGGTGNGTNIYVVDSGVSDPGGELTGRLETGYNAIDDNSNTADCNGHGSHVAGIAAGVVHGVAKGATVVPVKVLDCDGYGDSYSIILGLYWVYYDFYTAAKPGIINFSVGSDYIDPVVSDTFSFLTADWQLDASQSYRLTAVVAAGNEARDACNNYISDTRAKNVIKVGSYTTNLISPVNFLDDSWFDTYYDFVAVSDFSNYGPCVDLYAPGEYISSIDPFDDGSNSYSTLMSGTSMAAPFVAGAAARYLENRPNFPASFVSSYLTGNAKKNQLIFPTWSIETSSNNRMLYIPEYDWWTDGESEWLNTNEYAPGAVSNLKLTWNETLKTHTVSFTFPKVKNYEKLKWGYQNVMQVVVTNEKDGVTKVYDSHSAYEPAECYVGEACVDLPNAAPEVDYVGTFTANLGDLSEFVSDGSARIKVKVRIGSAPLDIDGWIDCSWNPPGGECEQNIVVWSPFTTSNATLPLAPKLGEVLAESAGNGQVFLSWDEVEGITSYVVEAYDSNENKIGTFTTATNSYTYKVKSVGNTYFKVRTSKTGYRAGPASEAEFFYWPDYADMQISVGEVGNAVYAKWSNTPLGVAAPTTFQTDYLCFYDNYDSQDFAFSFSYKIPKLKGTYTVGSSPVMPFPVGCYVEVFGLDATGTPIYFDIDAVNISGESEPTLELMQVSNAKGLPLIYATWDAQIAGSGFPTKYKVELYNYALAKPLVETYDPKTVVSSWISKATVKLNTEYTVKLWVEVQDPVLGLKWMLLKETQSIWIE